MKPLKLKRYGTDQVAEKSFRQKNRLNLRLKELNITERIFDMFKDNNRRLLTERKLFEFKNSNIDFLKSVQCYRGMRHKARLPVLGQRTHTNASKKIFKRRRYE